MSTPVYVLDGHGRTLPSAVRVRSVEDVRRAYADTKRSVWLARDVASLRLLAKAVGSGRPRHGLVASKTISADRRVLLDALFAVVVDPGSTQMLPRDELNEVLVADNRADLFVAAHAVPEDDALVIFRGDLRSLIVPLSFFKAKKGGPKPDPRKVSVTDYGQTVRLGEYEIAAEALLYELDPEARRRAKRREVQTDDSLGASVRRLRLQRGVSRSDFGSLSAKTIARIERGESEPRGTTLATIATTLGVSADELQSF